MTFCSWVPLKFSNGQWDIQTVLSNHSVCLRLLRVRSTAECCFHLCLFVHGGGYPLTFDAWSFVGGYSLASGATPFLGCSSGYAQSPVPVPAWSIDTLSPTWLGQWGTPLLQICRGRLASYGHKGGFSCFTSNSTEFNRILFVPE